MSARDEYLGLDGTTTTEVEPEPTVETVPVQSRAKLILILAAAVKTPMLAQIPGALDVITSLRLRTLVSEIADVVQDHWTKYGAITMPILDAAVRAIEPRFVRMNNDLPDAQARIREEWDEILATKVPSADAVADVVKKDLKAIYTARMLSSMELQKVSFEDAVAEYNRQVAALDVPKAAVAKPLAVIWGNDVQMENVDWIWDGRIPRGAITLIVGDPEDGKTTYCIGDYAARISRGANWPDGKRGSGVGERIMYLSSEDSNSTTLMPRFVAGGGDPIMICFETLTEGIAPLNSLDTDIARLEATVVATGVKHLLFDPLNAYLPKVNTWKDSDIRSALRPLVSLAEKYGLTILVIIHLNKKSDGPAIGRVMGSMGNVALARASYLIGKDPENPARRFFVKHKFNLGPPPPALAFTVAQIVLDGVKDPKGNPVFASTITWETNPVAVTAEQVLKPPKPEKDTKQDRAIALIRSMVKDGPRLAEEIDQAVRDLGISERTLKNAKAESGAQPIKPKWKNAPWYRTPPGWTEEQRSEWLKTQKRGKKGG